MAWTQNINRNSDEVEHDRRNVKHVVGPVAPAGEESVKVAENFFGPEINSAFAGIAMRQLNDGDSLRPKEKYQRDDPQPDGDASVGGDRRHYIQIKYSNNKKQ